MHIEREREKKGNNYIRFFSLSARAMRQSALLRFLSKDSTNYRFSFSTAAPLVMNEAMTRGQSAMLKFSLHARSLGLEPKSDLTYYSPVFLSFCPRTAGSSAREIYTNQSRWNLHKFSERASERGKRKRHGDELLTRPLRSSSRSRRANIGRNLIRHGPSQTASHEEKDDQAGR